MPMARLPLLFLLLLSLATAQHKNGPRPYVGGSLGFGGLYNWGKISLDFKYHYSALHLSPGPSFLSLGFTQQVFPVYSRLQRRHAAILELNWHDDWGLLTLQRSQKGNDLTRDLDMYNLLAGLHLDLRPQGMVYLEVSGGLLYVVEKFNTPTEATLPLPNKQYIYPMGQIRLGVWVRRKPRMDMFSKPVKWYYHRKETH